MRRFGVSMIAVGLMFGLVSCGGSEDVADGDLTPEDSTAVETTAPDTTAPDTTASTEPTTTEPTTTEPTTTEPTTTEPDVPVLSEQNFVEELTAAQADAGSAHIDATIGSPAGQTVKMTADVDGLGNPGNLAMDVSLDIADQQLKMVLVGEGLYLQGEGISPDPAKPWVKVDISDPNNPLSPVFDAANPTNFTAYLEGVTGFKDQGIETVDGVEARHYSVTVDTAKMLATNPAFQGQETSGLGLPDEVTSEVYVNGDNLPVEISVTMGSVGSVEAHFSDYGEPVDVKAPPASQVTEFGQ